ncbi:MAG: tetratricopeptide repeat protein [Saprospiraceae bacterium]|nr:tetratricopeptide repeat protein [Saprospiraceae bacterium]
MKKLYILASLILLTFGAIAQVNVDSLWALWSNPNQADTVRLRAIQDIAWSLMYSNPDSTALLANQGIQFAQKIGSEKWEGKLLNTIGGTYHVKGDYPEALKNYQKALVMLKKAGELKGVASMYNNLGLIYREKGNNRKALEFYEKYFKIGEDLQNSDILSAAFNNLGTLYSDQTNYSKALEYYRKGLEFAEKLGDKYGIAIAYNNIGSIYYNQRVYTDALEYYHKSLGLRQEVGDQRGVGLMYNNIGLIYQEQKDYPIAFEYYQKALAIHEQLGDKPSLSNTYYSLGTLFTDQRSYQKAVAWCAKGLAVSEEIGALRPARNACSCLYEAYKGMGNMAKALVWHEQFVALNDSLQQEEIDQRLDQMEFEKEMLTDSLMREEEKQHIKISYQLDLNKKTQTRNLILVVSIGILFLAIVFLSRMLYFQKRSEGLQDKTQQLEKQQLINEIDLLKTQVNPHFLFNSLSILSSLVHVNADLSEQFIEQLARSYRYILEQKDQTLVSLRTELEFIRSYAFLLKIRFDNKFDLRMQIAESDLDRYKIAPLTLQLLLENAVKHNRMSAQDPLVVEVLVDNDFLVVKNPLRMRPQREPSTGTGLNNIINRYALLTDRTVKAGECEDSFIVRVPLLNASIPVVQ